MSESEKVRKWVAGLFARVFGQRLPRPPGVLIDGEAERLVATAKALVVDYNVTVDCLVQWMRLGAVLSDHGIRPEHLRFLESSKLRGILDNKTKES